MLGLYWEKDADDGRNYQERGTGKAYKVVCGCVERGHGMMAVVEVTRDDEDDRTEWRWNGNERREKLKEEEEGRSALLK